jgi:hypothetical protein
MTAARYEPERSIMNTTRECTSASPIQGSLLRLSEHREVAIYLREGAAWVADFNNGRAELHSASAWYTTGDGRMLVHAQRRDVVETISPLPDEVARRIESLHRRMEEPTVGPAVQLALATMLGVFRHPRSSTHFN